MAERRMFTQKITESDAFLDMPLSSQALYFHLCMNADDDGFVKNPKRISRMMGACDDDMRLLVAKSFVITYDTGVIVIKHWRMHNLLRKDRYKETEYTDEKSMLNIKKNGAYTLDKSQGKPLIEVVRQPNGNQMTPQDSIGKDSIDKDSIEKENTKESSSLSDSGETFDFEDAWKKTFDIYPKKTAYNTAKTAWMDKVLEVIEENQPDIARLLYKATEAYLSDYQEKHPDDTAFQFIPKYAEWLKDDCDYWLQIAEKRGDCS